MSTAHPFIQEHRKFLDGVTWPIYATRLDDGTFHYVNAAFTQLIGYTLDELTAGSISARSLYAREAERFKWARQMRNANTHVASFAEMVMNPMHNKTNSRLFVVDIAIRPSESDPNFALGLLADVSEHQFEREILQHRLAAYQELLDLPWINVGVHEIDSDGNVTWMNRADKKLIGPRSEPSRPKFHVVDFSKEEKEAKKERVHRKILGTAELTKGEHRTYFNEKETKSVPVNIDDFGIEEPNPIHEHRYYRGLITAVRDEKAGITPLLKPFVPENPILEELGICAFLKVRRKFAARFDARFADLMAAGPENDFIFVFGNSLFLAELQALAKTDQIRAQPHKVYGYLGKTERELFHEFAASYTTADEHVMEQKEEDQRIEKHPCKKGAAPVDVQVLKRPLYAFEVHQDDPVPDEVIGVQGFYWEAGSNNLLEQLQKLFEPWDILDRVPVPLYCKNHELRFTYVNKAFVDHVRETAKSHSPLSARDIIGKKDADIFGAEIARRYEADDQRVRQTKEKHDDLEPHGSETVRVIKIPLEKSHTDQNEQPVKTTGVQGIFWRLHDQERPPKVRIDWRTGSIVAEGYEPFDVKATFLQRWGVFELLAQNLDNPVSASDILKQILRKSFNVRNVNHLQKEVSDLRAELRGTPFDVTNVKIEKNVTSANGAKETHPGYMLKMVKSPQTAGDGAFAPKTK